MEQVQRIQDLGNLQSTLERSGVSRPKEPTHNGMQIHHCTDLGNAKRLTDRHGHDLWFVPEVGWLIWDGKRWKKDGSREVERRMQETVASIYTEASNSPDKDTRKRLAKHATSSESLNKMRAAIGVAESLLTADIQDFDTDPLLFNASNGVIDLRTGKLRDHSRDDLISQLAPVDYDQGAAAPQFIEFLKRIFDGNQNLIGFIQRAFGYGLTGLTDEHCFFIGWGGGANGKTTLFRTYLKALGDYAKVTSAETLLIKRQPQAINNDVARLRGARVVIASEAEEGRRLAESLVKEMTGEDRVQARFLYHESFEFVPTFKLFLATNHKPVVKGTDHAIWRRIRLIPFSVTIPPEEQDRKLMDKLETELPGILAWAVQGCLEWQEVGLRTPDEVRKATGEYRKDMDVLAPFLSDCCKTSPAFHDSAKELYRNYGEWADENGERKLSQKRFGQYLTERGFESCRITSGPDKGKREWVGIGLKE